MKLNCVNIATTKVLEMSIFYSLVLNKPYHERNLYRYEILIDNCCIVITYTENKTLINPDCCGLEFIVDDVDVFVLKCSASYVLLFGVPYIYPT